MFNQIFLDLTQFPTYICMLEKEENDGRGEDLEPLEYLPDNIVTGASLELVVEDVNKWILLTTRDQKVRTSQIKHSLTRYLKSREIQVGDVCFYNHTTNNLEIHEFTGRKDSNLSPIGIVVIPPSHNVYGTNDLTIMSLRYMDPMNPDSGSSKPTDLYRSRSTNLEASMVEFFETVPVFSASDTQNSIKLSTSSAYLPIDHFYEYSETPQLSISDPGTYYQFSSNDAIPSPYLADGSRNPDYYNRTSNNALSDFDGFNNTKVLTDLITDENWKTANTITNSSSDDNYPAAACCWRYHTEGTQQGDWYLPAAGELGYVVTRSAMLNNTLTQLALCYPDVITELYQHHLYSSTCFESGGVSYFVSCSSMSGMVELSGGYLVSVLAFSRINIPQEKDENIDLPQYVTKLSMQIDSHIEQLTCTKHKTALDDDYVWFYVCNIDTTNETFTPRSGLTISKTFRAKASKNIDLWFLSVPKDYIDRTFTIIDDEEDTYPETVLAELGTSLVLQLTSEYLDFTINHEEELLLILESPAGDVNYSDCVVYLDLNTPGNQIQKLDERYLIELNYITQQIPMELDENGGVFKVFNRLAINNVVFPVSDDNIQYSIYSDVEFEGMTAQLADYSKVTITHSTPELVNGMVTYKEGAITITYEDKSMVAAPILNEIHTTKYIENAYITVKAIKCLTGENYLVLATSMGLLDLLQKLNQQLESRIAALEAKLNTTES